MAFANKYNVNAKLDNLRSLANVAYLKRVVEAIRTKTKALSSPATSLPQ